MASLNKSSTDDDHNKTDPITEVTIIQRPKRHFTYINGDQYFGEYGIDFTTKKIFRHGCGSYVTSNCTIYQGKWTFDKLLDCVTIKYPNKHTFCGYLNLMGDYQMGTYDFDDQCRVCGNFQDSSGLELHDLNGTVWKTMLTSAYLSVTNKRVA